jgi:hypothetical protein
VRAPSSIDFSKSNPKKINHQGHQGHKEEREILVNLVSLVVHVFGFAKCRHRASILRDSLPVRRVSVSDGSRLTMRPMLGI